MKKFRRAIAILLGVSLVTAALAQTFRPNQVLTADELNSAFAFARITGGSIDGATIGFTSPRSGTFTTVTAGTPIAPASGGTGVANGTQNTLTFGGNYSLQFNLTGSTVLALPTTGTITTLGSATTGTGTTIVLANSPTLNTPILGTATATALTTSAVTATNLTATNMTVSALAGTGTTLSLSALTGTATTLRVNALTTTSVSVKNLLATITSPSILSGFGSSPSISLNNGSATFRVTVGTGGTSTTGTLGLPTATSGWNCFADNLTTTSAGVFRTKQTGAGTVTSVTLVSYSTTAAIVPWTASDVLAVSCLAL